MARWSRLFAVVLTILGAAAAPVLAQIQTGSLLVRAVDDQNAVVPGVTVTVTSPVLPQAMVGVTDSSGIFQMPGLGVGTYTVKTALQGFQTVSARERRRASGPDGQRSTSSMKVSALSEEVTVQAASRRSSTRRAPTSTSTSTRTCSRTRRAARTSGTSSNTRCPGSSSTSPDVGGNQAGLQRAFTARGTPNAQNMQLLNGVNVGDPAALGFSMNYYDPSVVREHPGLDAARRTSRSGPSGVVINMVTKSGTNRFSGQVLQTYQGEATQWDNIDEALQAGRVPAERERDRLHHQHELPGRRAARQEQAVLLRLLQLSSRRTSTSPGFPAVVARARRSSATPATQDTTDIIDRHRPADVAQIAAQPVRRLRIASQRYDKPNRGAGAGVTQDSTSKEYDIDNVAQGLWNWVLSRPPVRHDARSATTTCTSRSTRRRTMQPLDGHARPASSIATATSSAIMFRRRLEVQSNWTVLHAAVPGRPSRVQGRIRQRATRRRTSRPSASTTST